MTKSRTEMKVVHPLEVALPTRGDTPPIWGPSWEYIQDIKKKCINLQKYAQHHKRQNRIPKWLFPPAPPPPLRPERRVHFPTAFRGTRISSEQEQGGLLMPLMPNLQIRLEARQSSGVPRIGHSHPARWCFVSPRGRRLQLARATPSHSHSQT
jgi:hypothetical protein